MSSFPKKEAAKINISEHGAGQSILPDVKKLLSSMEKDDLILGGILAMLFFEGSDDYLLMAAIGYLFVMGLKKDK